ncbi:hypothetical protein [Intestinibacillus massiliensis]|uniref:hypothetical protein n=1 Tax=Intestinibacillus massiliensis TaxID=1871029 RepID=UPI000B35AB7C|nr:hypothetical protein [Intestinibacillus massiliensis]
MPKWTYQLTVFNQLDRTLHLDNANIAWGGKDSGSDNFPDDIEPGKTAKYFVHSPAGTATGIEFYLTFSDTPPSGSTRYGTLRVSVDMPYWKHKNTSSCDTTGLLQATGFQKIPDGNHDFSTSVTISRSL